MDWSLAIIALALLGVAAISRRLTGSPVTPAMVFVAFGLLVGPKVLDELDLASTGSTVRALAEATLALVLFSDASRINLRQLRPDVGVPLRLLGIGLPLTIGLGALAGAVILDQLSVGEALILAIILAPTDAALGQAVVTEKKVPIRIREGSTSRAGSTTVSASRCCLRRWRSPTSTPRSPAAAVPAPCCWRRSATGCSAESPQASWWRRSSTSAAAGI
jgi:NhaP-type Na+/H+ and K+/H+ antiporter